MYEHVTNVLSSTIISLDICLPAVIRWRVISSGFTIMFLQQLSLFVSLPCRNVGRVAGAGAAIGTAAGLTAATTGGVVAASGATVYGGAAIVVSLANVGAVVGGSAAAGAVVIAAAPAVALVGVGAAIFGLLRATEDDVEIMKETLRLGDMQQYAEVLVKHGVKRRSTFKTVNEKQLKLIPIANFAHRKKLLLLSEYVQGL